MNDVGSRGLGLFNILVVDSGKKLTSQLERGLEGMARVERAATADTAMQIIARQPTDLVITQTRLPLYSGLDLAGELKRVKPELPILLVGSGNFAEDTKELSKLGYPPPMQWPEEVQELIRRSRDILFGVDRLLHSRMLREELRRSFGFDQILTLHPKMRVVLERLRRIVASRVPVLITGESGTGKELVARMIHSTSERSKKIFVTVNCAAVPEGLLESQFFGHEKGSFTGASQRVLGKFEMANNGTLFLDEIGEMTVALQSKLLRVIEYGEFQRVGGSETLKVDVRLITATNRNLEKMVAAGGFRADLFYRINVFPIELPPLRERGDDVVLLAYHFLWTASHRNNRQVRAIHSDALSLLQSYPWPGNIRELENAVERALLLSDGIELRKEDFPLLMDWDQANGLLEEPLPVEEEEHSSNGFMQTDQIRTLADVEREAVRHALDVTGGNIALAARSLGIARGTLYKKMEEHGITWGREKG